MKTDRSLRLAAATVALCAIAAPAAKAEEIYITGFGHVFSAGICGLGDGRCVSYLGIEGTIDDLCRQPPKTPIRIVGHSMGGSAAIKAVNGLHACGLKVAAAVFLDPQTHPSAFGLPRGLRSWTIYSRSFAGIGEGHCDADSYGGGHIMQAFDPGLLARVRAFLDGAAPARVRVSKDGRC